jgi:glycosyltransferase involved in cell wall biosynthesis
VRILYHHRTQAEDGQAVHIRSLQRAFAEEGHEVREFGLVSRAGSGQASDERDGGSRWGVLTHLPRFARELAEYAYTPVARPRLISAARQLSADFIYERYAFGNAAGLQAARRVGCPLVLEVNSPMVLELENTRGLSFPGVARRMEAHVFKSADLVCVVTGVLRDMLVELGVDRERLLVTPNGVHLDQYPPDDESARTAARRALGIGAAHDGRTVLGFVGYYRPWHRLDLVVEGLARDALAETVLVLVGEGPAHEELIRTAEASGVKDRLIFAGARAHDEIPELLPAFDVALVPAINPYASPLKLFEYMAAGLAVIAPDQPNLREVLESDANALLVTPDDGAELCAAIERLVSDPALRCQLGKAARRTVVQRDLTWRGNARRVIAAVEGLS